MFDPVQRYQGFISDIVGDAMLALWTAAKKDNSLINKACLATLAIRETVDNFNNNQQYPLPTRFGMHAGQIRLGNIGSASRFEYRPVGDCVNTSNRIERLNKVLGTHLLISEEVVPNEQVCVTRHVGSFLLAGKSKPLDLYQLIGKPSQVTDTQLEMYQLFDQALIAYTEGNLEHAHYLFDIVLQHFPTDGPTMFYYQRCVCYLSDPEKTEAWTPIVRL